MRPAQKRACIIFRAVLPDPGNLPLVSKVVTHDPCVLRSVGIVSRVGNIGGGIPVEILPGKTVRVDLHAARRLVRSEGQQDRRPEWDVYS